MQKARFDRRVSERCNDYSGIVEEPLVYNDLKKRSQVGREKCLWVQEER